MKRLISLCLSSVLLSGAAFAAQPTQDTGAAVGQGQAQGQTATSEETSQPAVSQEGQTQGQVAQQGATEEAIAQPITAEERDLVYDVHANSINEIKLALTALTRPVSRDVRDFAWKMVNDHLKSEMMLSDISREYGLDFSSEKVVQDLKSRFDEGKQDIDMLDSVADADFEKAFIDHLKQRHDELLQKLDSAPADLANTHLGDFIKQAQDIVKGHEADIDRLTAEEMTGGTEQPSVDQPSTGSSVEQPVIKGETQLPADSTAG